MMVVALTAIAVLEWKDRADRSSGPEAPVVLYGAAVGRQDLKGALDQLIPEARPASASFVAWQLGNRYTILESAVRSNSVLDRLLGRPDVGTTVVVTLEVQEEGGPVWRTTEEIPVVSRDGRWYLRRPPLMPDS